MTVLNIFPNPTNNLLSIEFELSVASKVFLSIFNISGQEVHQIFNGKKMKGMYKFKWNSKDLPNGVYFIKLQIDNRIIIQKALKH